MGRKLIFVTIFLDLVGFGIVIPVLPLYAERFGASPLVIGLLVGIYSVMQTIFAPVLGRLSDRVGRRPVLLLSILGTSAGFVLMGLANSLWLLFAARAIDGMTGGNISTAQAYIADITPPHERSRGMGLIGAAFGLGFIFGPAIGGLMSHISLSAPFFFAALLAAVNATAIYFFLPESLSEERRHEAHKHDSFSVFVHWMEQKTLGIIFTVYFLTTISFSLLTSTYSLFAERRFSYTAPQIGYIFAGLGLMGAIIQGGLMGKLVHKLGEKKLIIIGAFVLALTMFFLPRGNSSIFVLLSTVGIAIGHSLLLAPLNGLASKSVNDASQGRVLGMMQSSASFARIIGPVLGGLLLNHDLLDQTKTFGTTAYAVGGAVALLAVGLAIAL